MKLTITITIINPLSKSNSLAVYNTKLMNVYKLTVTKPISVSGLTGLNII